MSYESILGKLQEYNLKCPILLKTAVNVQKSLAYNKEI